MAKHNLETHPVHLGKDATAIPQPEFPRDERAMQWYEEYGRRHADDGTEGRLVSLFNFTGDWVGWEVHPNGAELVVCLEGEMELIQEMEDGSHRSTLLGPGEYAINPPGVWHTANVRHAAKGLFVTAGAGTQGRPRKDRLSGG